jgi:Relaxase/Mobilisation nuclease domain
MIPRIAQLGHGFAGAGLYYLHDKRDAKNEPDRPTAEDYHLRDKGGVQTNTRVGFTATRNLPTEDPHKALRCMQWLAANAQNVRQAAVAASAKAAGMSYADYVRAANPYRGRKGQKPLYSVSIAWHPSKNKKPTQAHMLAAADEVLKTLGMQDRQALIIEHKDTKHPHVHLIVNRVSPETGLYAKVGNDRLTLSRWAMDYERRTGLVLCLERVENWKRRDAGRIDKAERRKTDPQAKGEYVLSRNTPRRDHDWFKSVAHLPANQIRQARSARQEREHEQLTRKLADGTAKLEGQLTRRYGLQLKDTENEIDRLQRAEYWRKKRDADPMALVLVPRHAFHALVDLATGRKHLRPRKILALQNAVMDLRQALRTARRTDENIRNNAWFKLTCRHNAERQRDEDRIERLGRIAQSKGTTDRGRTVFNLRGDKETARFVTPKQPLIRLSDIHARVAETAQATKSFARSALSNVVRALGGKADPADLRRRTIGEKGMSVQRLGLLQKAGTIDHKKPIAPQPHNMEIDVDAAQVGRSPDMQSQVESRRGDIAREKPKQTADRRPVTPAERAAFEARRDAALTRIEHEQIEKHRRKRTRPRGKTRRLQ